MEAVIIDAKDITAIVDNDLCHSCGACANVCHPEVISFYETEAGHVFPKINYEGCTACELCSAVCPGIKFNTTMTSIMEEVGNPFEGNVFHTKIGQSKDHEILENSQSGGVASAIILSALENNLIDTAIVAVMSNESSVHGDVILAYNREDILASQRSKYIPISLLTALSIVKKNKERFALVGLSCHIHGLHNVLDSKPTLKKQFIFSIGLVCDRVMVNTGMDYLINKTGVMKKDVTEFYFRDKQPYGYPGHVHIKTSNKSYILPPEERMSIKDYFTPARCRICFDKMNIGADITIGDPHGIENVDRIKGESLIITRTKMGEKILNLIDNVEFRLGKYEDALNGQSIERKKEDWRGYMEEWIGLNKPVPSYYKYISSFTKKPDSKKYRLNLDQALFLRIAKNRDTLIKAYYQKVKYHKLKRKLLYPASFIKRVLIKMKKELLR